MSDTLVGMHVSKVIQEVDDVLFFRECKGSTEASLQYKHPFVTVRVSILSVCLKAEGEHRG